MFFCYIVSGDGRLAKNVKNKVFSFDLVSNDPSVIACDISKVCAFIWSRVQEDYLELKGFQNVHKQF